MAFSPTVPTIPLPPSGATAGNTLSFRGLNQLEAAARADPRNPQAIEAVSQQFEALLLQQMLTAIDATHLGPDLLGDTSGPMYKSLYTQQLALTLSQGGGIGLARFIARELSTRYAAAQTPASTAPATPAAPGERAAAANAAVLPQPSAGHGAIGAKTLAAYRQLALLPQPAAHAPQTAATPLSAAARTGAHAAAADAADPAREFIASILPSVQSAARQLGVSPVAILAQAALETGWGRHTPGNNVFGVKADAAWGGSTVQSLTREFRDGVAAIGTAAFRAYRSVADSVQNYAALLSRPRYQAVRGRGDDIAGFASALQRSGYATDPQYAAKLVAVAYSPRMQQVLAQLGVGSSSPAR
jgi:flagellar protein FlgJ